MVLSEVSASEKHIHPPKSQMHLSRVTFDVEEENDAACTRRVLKKHTDEETQDDEAVNGEAVVPGHIEELNDFDDNASFVEWKDMWSRVNRADTRTGHSGL
jgi:hypothetical protein